jgi:hypothetical protein
MASAIWSRNSEYFRGLCTNQLKIEDDGGLVLGEGGACPPACVQPFPRTPVPGCLGCDELERPNQWPYVMTLKLPQELTFRTPAATSGSGTATFPPWISAIDAVAIQTTGTKTWTTEYPPAITGNQFQLFNYQQAFEESGEEPTPGQGATSCRWVWCEGQARMDGFKPTELTTDAVRTHVDGLDTYRAYGLVKTGDHLEESGSIALGNSYFRDIDFLRYVGGFGMTGTWPNTLHKKWAEVYQNDPKFQWGQRFYYIPGLDVLSPAGPPPVAAGKVAYGFYWDLQQVILGHRWELVWGGGVPYLNLYAVKFPTVDVTISTNDTGPFWRTTAFSRDSAHYVAGRIPWEHPTPSPLLSGGTNFPGGIIAQDDYEYRARGSVGSFAQYGTWNPGEEPGNGPYRPYGDLGGSGSGAGEWRLGTWQFLGSPQCSSEEWVEGTKTYDYNDNWTFIPPVTGPTNLPDKLWINVGTSGL